LTFYRTPVYSFDVRGLREVYVAIETASPFVEATSGFEIVLIVVQGGIKMRQVVEDGVLTRLENLDSVQAVVNFHNSFNTVLSALTVGWREIDE